MTSDGKVIETEMAPEIAPPEADETSFLYVSGGRCLRLRGGLPLPVTWRKAIWK